MTLDEFKAEVVAALPALASWEYTERLGARYGNMLTATHPSGVYVGRADSTLGVYWCVYIHGMADSLSPTLDGALARFRERTRGVAHALADLKVAP